MLNEDEIKHARAAIDAAEPDRLHRLALMRRVARALDGTLCLTLHFPKTDARHREIGNGRFDNRHEWLAGEPRAIALAEGLKLWASEKNPELELARRADQVAEEDTRVELARIANQKDDEARRIADLRAHAERKQSAWRALSREGRAAVRASLDEEKAPLVEHLRNEPVEAGAPPAGFVA